MSNNLLTFCFRIPNEELKRWTPQDVEDVMKFSFRIPNEELKPIKLKHSLEISRCFRIPNEELKQPTVCVKPTDAWRVLEYLMRN